MKIRLARNYAMLDCLCKPCTQLSKWKCGKGLGVYEHDRRRVESADQILARGGVDRGLSADRGIDNGYERCRYLNDWDSTHEVGCHEAGEVSHYSSAKGDDGRVPAVSLGE